MYILHIHLACVIYCMLHTHYMLCAINYLASIFLYVMYHILYVGHVVYVCVYIYMYIHVYIYIYIHTMRIV